MLGGVEGEATREDAEPVEHSALGFAEQVVGPVDRGTQGVVALHRGASTTRQQPEPFVEAGRDVGRLHRRDPRRRELERQRDPVEALTDLHDRRCGRVVEHEP